MWEALIWAVPLAVVAAGIRRPDGGLLVLAATLPLFGSPPGGPYQAALDAAALGAVVTAWRAGAAPRSPLARPALAFLVVGLASALPLLYQPPGWHPRFLAGTLAALLEVESWSPLFTWRAALNLVLGWLLFVSVRRAFAGRSPRPLAMAFAAGLVPLLLLGLAAHFGLIDLGGYRPIGGEIYENRLHSLFFHSGWLGEYLVLTVPFAAAGLLTGKAKGWMSGAGAALALTGLTAVTLLFVAQRAAWLAAAVQVATFALLAGRVLLRDRRLLWRTLLAAAVAITVAAGFLAFRSDLRESLGLRLERTTRLAGRAWVWDASLQMAVERPLLGWGVGAFAPVYRALKMEEVAGPYDWLTAHNHYLMLFAERGVLGLAAALALFWALAVVLLALLRQPDRERRTWGRALTIVFAGAAVYALAQYLFFLKSIEWTSWLLLGAAAAVAPRQAASRLGDRVAWTLVVLALLLVPWRLFTASAIDPPGNRGYGFHHVEGYGDEAFQWTHGRAAKRIPWAGETLVLRVANGHPRPGEHPVEIVVRIDGGEVARRTLTGGWQELRIHTGPARAETMVVGIEAHPTFRPFSELRRFPGLPPSRDIRSLGVAVRSPSWE